MSATKTAERTTGLFRGNSSPVLIFDMSSRKQRAERLDKLDRLTDTLIGLVF